MLHNKLAPSLVNLYSVLLIEAYHMYLMLHVGLKHHQKHPNEYPDHFGVSRSFCRIMARGGKCSYQGPNSINRADVIAGELVYALTACHFVLWPHNHYRRCFVPTPHHANILLNCAVFAVYHFQVRLDPFLGYSSLIFIVGAVDALADVFF